MNTKYESKEKKLTLDDVISHFNPNHDLDDNLKSKHQGSFGILAQMRKGMNHLLINALEEMQEWDEPKYNETTAFVEQINSFMIALESYYIQDLRAKPLPKMEVKNMR